MTFTRASLRNEGLNLCLLLSSGVLSFGVLVSTPVAATTSPPRCASTGSVDFGMDLAGSNWRFRTGDDVSWANPSFDRRTFTLPPRPGGLTDAAVIAALGFVDDADQTFLNGQEVGRTGGFPPSFDSAWDVPREYYPQDGLLRWGATNLLAVRMYDGTGGGGFYKGPVGLFSKARLRTLSGLETVAATPRQLKEACTVLDQQHRAAAAGDVPGYAAALAPDFFHQGDTADRRLRDLRAMVSRYGAVELRDHQAEVVVDRQGRLVVDTIRSWVTAAGTEILPPTRGFLHLDPRRSTELDDHSRFFRDSYDSSAMAGRAWFNVYLPPIYTKTTARRYPTVFMLHGINGSNIEWEVRDMDAVVDRLVAEKGIEESVIVFPDGSSGWCVDSSAGNNRTMIVEELLPLGDCELRTIPDRHHRGLTGLSMGGLGAFSIGLSHPDLFSSIASHGRARPSSPGGHRRRDDR